MFHNDFQLVDPHPSSAEADSQTQAEQVCAVSDSRVWEWVCDLSGAGAAVRARSDRSKHHNQADCPDQ